MHEQLAGLLSALYWQILIDPDSGVVDDALYDAVATGYVRAGSAAGAAAGKAADGDGAAVADEDGAAVADEAAAASVADAVAAVAAGLLAKVESAAVASSVPCCQSRASFGQQQLPP